MKFTNVRAFEKHLKEALPDHYAKCYGLLDTDAYSLQLFSKGIALYLKADKKEIFYGEKVTLHDLEDKLNSLSLFYKNELLIIHNAHLLKTNCLKFLKSYFKNPTPTITLVVTSLKKEVFFKHLEKEGIVLDLLNEKPWDREDRLVEWVLKKFKKEKKEVSSFLAKSIVNRFGKNHGLIAQEIDKLICFLGNRRALTKDDVSFLCSHNEKEKIWDLFTAIMQKEAQKAYSLLEYLLEKGTTLNAFLISVRHQFSSSYKLLSLVNSGAPIEEIRLAFPQYRGNLLEKNIALATKAGEEFLKSGLLLLYNSELKLKSQMVEPKIFGEMVIAKILK